MGGDLFSLFEGSERQLLILIALVPVAVFVFWYGSRAVGKLRSTDSLRPHGRVLDDYRRPRKGDWRATVRELEGADPTPIAKARPGPVRFVGKLVAASGNLGGTPGRECVWRNRAGGRPDAAVGAELVVLADETGRCGIEGVEGAYVIAPAEKHTHHYENVSLYLGDKVEVYGTFEAEKADELDASSAKPTRAEDPDPTQFVHGTVVPQQGLDIRLIERDPAHPPAEEEAAAEDSP
jgi:hypothetical protein